MFGIGGTELFIILVIALIVLGPNKMPEIAKMLGRAMGELQKATSDLKNEIDVAGHRPADSHPESGQEETKTADGEENSASANKKNDDGKEEI